MSRRIITALTITSLLVLLLSPLYATAVPASGSARINKGPAPKVAAELATATETVRVVVQTKGQPTADLDRAIAGRAGARRGSYQALNAVVADLPADAIAALASRDDVVYVSPDRPVRAQMDVTREAVAASQVQAGLGQLPGLDGKGVGIAFIDSGVSATHPDFLKNGSSRIVASVDFTGDVPREGGRDQNGHGTGVAGVAAGSGAASTGYAGNYAGIAPGANIIDLKALDENGAGRTSSTLNALNWAILNKQRFGIRIVNLSLGTPVRESYHLDPLCKAVEHAVRGGLVVVCSAGNNGRTEEVIGYDANGDPIYRLVYGGINSPANSPYVITVGATDSHGTAKRSDDTVASFSSKGPTQFDHLVKPDLVAPGRRVVAPMSQDNPRSAVERPDRVVPPTAAGARANAYYRYSGTSFAAPVVSGVAALMLEANRSLTPLLVKAILVRTAQALPASQFATRAESLLSQSAGEVNAALAVEMASAVVPDADHLKAGDEILRPGVTLGSVEQPVVVGGETVSDSGRVLYSAGVLFINRPVLTNGIMLGDGILLGDGLILSDGIVFGDGIMITDGIMMTDGIMTGDGIMMSDGYTLGSGIMMGDGVVMGDGIVLTDSILFGDGIMLGDGILFSDGHLLSDGMALAEGIMVSDGHLLADGIMVSDGHLLADGITLTDGVMVGDGIIITDGIMMSDGYTLGNGILLGDGILIGDGILAAD